MKSVKDYTAITNKDYIELCETIIYMALDKAVPLHKIEQMNVVETIVTAEKINFVMRDIVMKKINDYFAEEIIEKEKSAFDEYDKLNGYVDDAQENTEIWDNCIKFINSLVRMAIKVFNDSFSLIQRQDIIELIEQVKFELEAIESEKETG